MRNVIDVPYLDQSVRYPTGCESVSAVMLLRYLGYEMSVDDLLSNIWTGRSLNFVRVSFTVRIPQNIFVEVPMMRSHLAAMHR